MTQHTLTEEEQAFVATLKQPENTDEVEFLIEYNKHASNAVREVIAKLLLKARNADGTIITEGIVYTIDNQGHCIGERLV